MNLGRFKLDYNYTAGQTGWGNAFNNNFKKLSQLVDLTVIDIVSSTPTTANINDSYVNTATNTVDVFYAVDAYDSYQIADLSGKIIHVQATDAVYYINNNSEITTVADLSTVYTKAETDSAFMSKNEKTLLASRAFENNSGYVCSQSIEHSSTSGAAAFTAGYVHFMPFFLSAGTYTEASFYVSTASAESNLTIAIYNSSLGIPNEKLYETAPIPTTTTGIKTISTNFIINEPGLYYVACFPKKIGVANGNSCAFVIDSLSAANINKNTLKVAGTRSSVLGYLLTNQNSMPQNASLATEINNSSAPQNIKNILIKKG